MQRNSHHHHHQLHATATSIPESTTFLPPLPSSSSSSILNYNDEDEVFKNEEKYPTNRLLKKPKLYKRPCFWIFLLICSFLLYLSLRNTFQFHICDGRCFFLTWRSMDSNPKPSPFDFPCSIPNERYQLPPTTFHHPSSSAVDSTLDLTSNPPHPHPHPHPYHIHQSWKTTQLPTKFIEWSTSWKVMHPNWTYHLWTDEDNREFIKQVYPWFLPFYDSYPKHIMRVDAVRYLYLHAFGGIYADLDLEALKPLDDLLQAPLVLGWLTKYHHGHGLPNAFMAANQPGHPLWLFLVAKTIENQWLYSGVEQVTGPHMLTEMIMEYIQHCSSSIQPQETTWSSIHSLDRTKMQFIGDVQLLPAGMIYPYSWVDPGQDRIICSATSNEFNATACKAKFPNAYAITYWTHSWGHSNILLQN